MSDFAGLDRDTLTQGMRFLVMVIDSPTTDPVIRESAQRWFAELDRYLMTHEIGPVPTLSLVHVMCGYRDIAHEWLAELPPESVAVQPVRVTMIHTLLEIVDVPMFADNVRLDAWDAITEVMQSLWHCAADDVEVEL